ncbi:hypothetical protein H2204_002366 [Knufia peltigerae]|uniref:Xylanolytic transcriptional activator regulatory domain-containing protein n=1 Tax=Knufia peltigerae TaxID=1002370 RepID=A0AA38YD28_9EURO|nr:hypothetical protein H2204_002366 [Knufia peltigerae]
MDGLSCSYPASPSSQDQMLINEKQNTRQSTGIDANAILSSVEDLEWRLNEFKAKLNDFNSSQPLAATGVKATTPALQASDVVTKKPDLRSPTSLPQKDSSEAYADARNFKYSLDALDSRLSTISGPDSSSQSREIGGWDAEERPDQPMSPPCSFPTSILDAKAKSDLESFTVDDVLQYLDTFHSVFGVLHPLPHLESLRLHVSTLLRAMKRSLWTRPTTPGDCGLLEILKIILAMTIILQHGVQTELTRQLYQSVENVICSATLCSRVSHDFRVLLFLVTLYHLTNGDLKLGSRAIMFALRTASEEGLFQKDALVTKYSDHKTRATIIHHLWGLYFLDRQLNFAAGLPKHVSDEDVDLPPPEQAPYLSAMCSYGVFGAHAWSKIVNRDALAAGEGPSEELVEALRCRLEQWHLELELDVRFDTSTIESDETFFTTPDDDDIGVYLKTLMYLRSNQIRILVLRPILMYRDAAQNSLSLVSESVTVATKSINVIYCMSQNPALYRKRQVILHHFLSSALAVLFLAAAFDAENRKSMIGIPALLTDSTELRKGMDLIDNYCGTSESARRLWTTFSRPRRRLVQLGFLEAQTQQRKEMPSLSIGSVGPDDNDSALYGMVDFDPQFELDQFNMDPASNLQWTNWFDGSVVDSSSHFGLPSWM